MKRISKTLTGIFAVILLSAVQVWANPLDFKNAVGVFAMSNSATSVYGLQYQSWCTDRIGFQIEGAAYYDSASGAYKPLDYNIAAEFQYRLYDTTWGTRTGTSLYAWLLAGHRGFIQNSYSWSDETESSEKTDSLYYADVIAGIGFGFDIMFVNHLSIPVQFGFMGQFPTESAIGFSFGTGLRYRF
ncbi:MAG: hypothetical protein M0P01_01660 [Treponema sp.]|nr:hypothetical protein [Treponema sp.]